MASKRTLCLVAANQKGFSLVEDPNGVQNRCFYQCIGKALGIPTDDVIDMLEEYMLMNQRVESVNEVQYITLSFYEMIKTCFVNK